MPTIADLARADERVFPTHARVERYYPATAAEEARGVLGRCLDRGEGPALLIGAPGTGKSMLLEVLADDLGKNRPVVCLTSAQLGTRRALLQSILFELGQPYRERDEGDLRLSLMEHLAGDDVRHTGLLLLVDEAQTLPTSLLEELRVISNVAHQGVPTVRLLMAGSQQLEETFTDPHAEAFNQRIVARCYLAPLSHQDTAQFIRGHLAAAGAQPDEVFAPEALDAVYRATDGIARLVNQVCDRALLIAAGHGQLKVTKEIVEGAWADLQQLPTPWNLPDTLAEPPVGSDESEQVVEFGPLSDDLANDAPAARVYEPAAEFFPEEEVGDEIEGTEVVAEPTVLATDATSVATPAFPTSDELFGGGFEEEIVIDDFATLEQSIPSTRPRVTSACDADLGRMLDEVSAASPVTYGVEQSIPVEPIPVEEDPRDPFSGLAVRDNSQNELPIDATELDDDEEDDALLNTIDNLASETQQFAAEESVAASEDYDYANEDINILVIEDELAIPVNTAAASRADYRQLFKTLRDS